LKSNLLLFFNINSILYKFINYYMNNINCNTNYNIYNKSNSMFDINDINYKKIIIFISQIIIFLILIILIIIEIIIFRI